MTSRGHNNDDSCTDANDLALYIKYKASVRRWLGLIDRLTNTGLLSMQNNLDYCNPDDKVSNAAAQSSKGGNSSN